MGRSSPAIRRWTCREAGHGCGASAPAPVGALLPLEGSRNRRRGARPLIHWAGGALAYMNDMDALPPEQPQAADCPHCLKPRALCVCDLVTPFDNRVAL